MPKKGLLQLKKELQQERWTSDGMTQEEVGEVLGMKRQQVDKVEKLALRKLKSRINRLYKKEDLL
jgi:DNA-directed RNA polymerase sigma subunit (sigma70/sigma32)